ncbi:MAG TPA: extracellular solute-binding protein [Ignavibacteria bacterium]|nr:extracellular solute-binding protein [Ignavibacteria bacterium]
MKIINALILFFTFIFIYAGCVNSDRRAVVIYSPHGKELLTEFEKRFEEKHPEIDIQWLDMGSQEVYDRIRNEKNNPQADLWWGSPSTLFMKAEKEDLLSEYKPSWSDKVSEYHKSKYDKWYGTFLTPEVIAFNKNVLNKETAPDSFDELLTDNWKGKIVIRNPMASGTMRIIYSSVIENSVKNNGNEEAGFEKLKQLDRNTNSYAADPTQMYLKLSSAETPVTLWNMPDILLQSALYNYPFDYNFLTPSTVVVIDGIALVKNSKNQEDAKLFYEFITSVESMAYQANKFYRIPSRLDIDENLKPEWLKKLTYNEMKIDWNLLSEKESEWMKKWDMDIKGKSKSN